MSENAPDQEASVLLSAVAAGDQQSPRTVDGDRAIGKAWLRRELAKLGLLIRNPGQITMTTCQSSHRHD